MLTEPVDGSPGAGPRSYRPPGTRRAGPHRRDRRQDGQDPGHQGRRPAPRAAGPVPARGVRGLLRPTAITPAVGGWSTSANPRRPGPPNASRRPWAPTTPFGWRDAVRAAAAATAGPSFTARANDGARTARSARPAPHNRGDHEVFAAWNPLRPWDFRPHRRAGRGHRRRAGARWWWSPAPGGQDRNHGRRVVWLVANGYADPGQVLGLTFTRKAAGQLLRRCAAGPAVRPPRVRAAGLADGEHLPRLRR